MRVGIIGSGWASKAFQRHLEARGVSYAILGRVSDYNALASILDGLAFVINAAGYTGKPNVDACENQKDLCLMGNAVLPGIIRRACAIKGIPWGHVSSGCIYTGDQWFKETDDPNFSFRQNNCSFYSGTKAMGEEILHGADKCYVWRLRIPFSADLSERSYLVKLMKYQKLVDVRNSISSMEDFVTACWQMVEMKAPYGTYNVVNPGSITTKDVCGILRRNGLKVTDDFYKSEEEFRAHVMAPRSNCTLDSSKLIKLGIWMDEIHTAVERAVRTITTKEKQ